MEAEADKLRELQEGVSEETHAVSTPATNGAGGSVAGGGGGGGSADGDTNMDEEDQATIDGRSIYVGNVRPLSLN
jgi:hypothetical protein